MEDKKGMKECCDNCGTCENGACSVSGHGHMGMCSYGGWHGRCGMGHWVLRAIVGIVILTFVFWAGIKLGELRSMLYNSDFGYGMMGGKSAVSNMMRNKFFYNVDPYDQSWMMGGYPSNLETKATPSGTAIPAK
ncbi:MAG: hypothetical protein LiPW15_170 [Parcubacteria group bacterium LiPW_15]|nr:MAG: hypothetical protein LiPW15_170 [Parcubacteria group bacterium LiPW_15]